jgi:hypothetical protein
LYDIQALKNPSILIEPSLFPRRIVMNPVKRDTKSKVGLKIRRMKACVNDRYLAQLVG